jgi:hypothetical protein
MLDHLLRTFNSSFILFRLSCCQTHLSAATEWMSTCGRYASARRTHNTSTRRERSTGRSSRSSRLIRWSGLHSRQTAPVEWTSRPVRRRHRRAALWATVRFCSTCCWHGVCCMLYAVGCRLYAVGCMLYAVGCMLYALCCMLYALCCMLYAVGCRL